MGEGVGHLFRSKANIKPPRNDIVQPLLVGYWYTLDKHQNVKFWVLRNGTNKRYSLLAVGFVCVALGSIVIVISGIPNTLLILVAAWSFARLSKRFESWLLRHRVFGPLIYDWRNYIEIRRRHFYSYV